MNVYFPTWCADIQQSGWRARASSRYSTWVTTRISRTADPTFETSTSSTIHRGMNRRFLLDIFFIRFFYVISSVVNSWHFRTDPRIRTTDLRLRMWLFFSVAFKIPTENKFFLCFLLITFLNVHLHKCSNIKSHKEVIKQARFFLHCLLDDGRIRTNKTNRILEAQKLTGPDPQHWINDSNSINRYAM